MIPHPGVGAVSGRRIVVEPVDGDWSLTDERGTRAVPGRTFAEEVLALESERPRWTWDTARVYPVLLEAGVRVERAWDLRLARRILRRAATIDPSWAAAPADAWDGAPVVDDGALPIDVEPPLGALAEADGQRRAVDASPSAGALRLLVTAESAGALAAAEMRHAGLPWRRDVHEALLTGLLGPRVPADRRPAVLEVLVEAIRQALDAPRLNPDSGAELARALRTAGVEVESTRAWALRQVVHPVIEPLLEYKKLARLHQANGWSWLDAWVDRDRFRPEYVVAGVVTGRWTARGGGALQLPKQIRSAVVADPGWRFVVADAAQLEPRVLAGMAGDLSMAEAGRGEDLYAGVVASGAASTRADAKLGMLGALYGATSGGGGRLLPRLAQRFPQAIALVEEAARQGERGGSVSTLLGRTSPAPTDRRHPAERDAAGPDADQVLERAVRTLARDRGRFTRNFVVQGTAAEWALCWLADLRQRLWRIGSGTVTDRPHLVYFLHDEVIVHTPAADSGAVEEAVRAAARTAGRVLFGDFPIDFPLDVAVVERYSDAG